MQRPFFVLGHISFNPINLISLLKYNCVPQLFDIIKIMPIVKGSQTFSYVSQFHTFQIRVLILYSKKTSKNHTKTTFWHRG